MNLSPRLKCLYDCVTPGKRFADIGTDHGYLAYALIQNGRSPSGIATDIHKEPLQKAVRLFEGSGYEDQMAFRLGSGLDVVKPGECDEIIIAGMGGYMIRDILRDNSETAHDAGRLILQPMNHADILRRFLAQDGYRIIDELVCREDQYFYQIIVAETGHMTFESDLDLLVGFTPMRHHTEEFREMLNDLILKSEQIIKNVSDIDTLKARQRETDCRQLLEGLLQLRKECTIECQSQ